MRLRREKRRSVTKSKILIMVLTCAMLLSVIGIPSVSATEDEDTSWSITNAATKPDISTIIPKKGELSDVEKKLSSRILQLTDDEFLLEGVNKDKLIKQMKDNKQISEVSPQGESRSISGLSVYVYIEVKKGSDLSDITPYVTKIKNQDAEAGIVTAWVDIDDIESLAALDSVVSIQEVIAPIVHSGSKLSEGDAIHHTDYVRAAVGADGTGVKIGILSDGVDHLWDAVTSGDLPNNVTVLNNTVGGDEGTAMLEIVHDLAPGAELYFHDCGTDKIDFKYAINDLVDAGCDIICDDIGWLQEPFFEEGYVASHIKNVISSSDIIYVSAAGNDANVHYQGMYKEAYNGWHDFSGNGDVLHELYTRLRPGEDVQVVLQWNDTFDSSSNDYDLFLFDALNEGGAIATSMRSQTGYGDPLEVAYYQNTSSEDMIIAINVLPYGTPADKILEVFVYGGDVADKNIVKSDSIYGHPAVEDVIACGAIPQNSPDSIESFSSRGPVTMLSGSRAKPDICGVDRVEVTGAGGFGSPFYGTSAAAPHVAAIAAVLKSRFPLKSNYQIRQLMLGNAVDLGSPGYDYIYGYGRADALLYWVVAFDSNGGTIVNSQSVMDGGNAAVPRQPINWGYILEGWYQESECTNWWSFGSNTVTDNTALYAKWEDWVAQKDRVKSGKLSRTYYNDNGRTNRIEEYYGADDSSGIKKIHYYTDGLRSSYRLFDTDGNLKNFIQLYEDGKTRKVNYYNVSTGVRSSYKLYDTKGRMTHMITCYSDGTKPKKTSYYNVETGQRTSYKLYDTAGRTTHLISCHPDGVKPKKTNYYNVSTGVRKSYKLYDTQGRTTHYAFCYSDGVKASKMNYYNVDTGKRSAYKTYRTDGSCSCHVICDSNGNPSVATYYDVNGDVTKVVHY